MSTTTTYPGCVCCAPCGGCTWLWSVVGFHWSKIVDSCSGDCICSPPPGFGIFDGQTETTICDPPV